MVIDPRKVFYQKDFSDPMNASVGQIGSEMDWVNLHFRDRIDILDRFYALLIGEWCPSDDIYQYWQKEFGKGPEWIMENAALVHFIVDWKPWDLTKLKVSFRQMPRFTATTSAGVSEMVGCQGQSLPRRIGCAFNVENDLLRLLSVEMNPVFAVPSGFIKHGD